MVFYFSFMLYLLHILGDEFPGNKEHSYKEKERKYKKAVDSGD